MEKFTGVDYFDTCSLLSEEELLVRDSVREFVSAEVIPIIEQYNRRSEFPRQLISKMGELGVFGATLPQEYGCAGLNNVSYGLMMQELERGDSSIRSFASVQSALVMYPIFTFGSQQQKEKWLPELASGNKIGCFGLTEPDFGSNPAGMLSKAEAVKGGYKLTGAKMWITNGTIADVAVVWAKLDGQITGFLVEKGKSDIPQLIAVLVKDDFKNLKETLLFSVENLDGESKESLQVMCSLLGVNFSNNSAEIKKNIINFVMKKIPPCLSFPRIGGWMQFVARTSGTFF
jgi:alkylation response protein AidB-like acyl-CoA dehydrogenase